MQPRFLASSCADKSCRISPGRLSRHSSADWARCSVDLASQLLQSRLRHAKAENPELLCQLRGLVGGLVSMQRGDAVLTLEEVGAALPICEMLVACHRNAFWRMKGDSTCMKLSGGARPGDDQATTLWQTSCSVLLSCES